VSRVSKRAWEFDSDAAVRVARESRGVGELAEPESVGAQGEELAAERAHVEGIAAGLEDDGLRHRVLKDDAVVPTPDRAAGTCRAGTGARRPEGTARRAEVGDLAQPAAENVNGEQLAVFVGVGPERVG